MSYIWTDKEQAGNAQGANRKPWSEPQIVRLRPGTPEYDRARKALLGHQED
ncbi:hypothetical protein [Novosphingobium aquae]|uniref:Uncharacterized protein n=1 Tax=Novosphingobium aquae TaxID=3133435 RepID=A0ABU8S6M2_9SPHN